MTASPLLIWFNFLAIWRRRVGVWGYSMQAITFDRWLYLFLHRVGLMGREDREFLRSRVLPGMRVVDVGANLGLYTVLLARCAGDAGSVIAIEPDPDLYEALRSNSQRNAAGNIELHNIAAGSAPGTLVLSRNLVNAGDNRVIPQGSKALVRQFTVPAATVDDIVAGRSVDFIKIDVQGWEWEVFAGMKQLMRANPRLQISFEYWPYGLRKAGCEPLELLTTLIDSGFELSEVSAGQCKRITQPESLRLPGKKYTNLLAVRPG